VVAAGRREDMAGELTVKGGETMMDESSCDFGEFLLEVVLPNFTNDDRTRRSHCNLHALNQNRIRLIVMFGFENSEFLL
jgi:hypothetical protein